MELVEPIESISNEEVTNFRASKVKDVGSPVGMFPAERIGVFIEGSAIKASQCPVVLGEVGGDPVQDHADAFLVETINQVTEVIGGSVA